MNGEVKSVKFQKKKILFFWGGGGGGGRVRRGGGHCRFERSSEVFVKIPKRNFWGGGGSGRGWGVMVDVNREVKSCENSKKKKNIFFFGGGGRFGGGGSGWMCTGRGEGNRKVMI